MNFNFLDEGCLLYTLIFFLTFFMTIFVNGKKERLGCFYFIVILEILLGGLRGMYVGADTYGYSQMIIPDLKNYTFKEILQGPTVLLAKEPICFCFLKLISAPFESYTPYFIILQIIFWIMIADTIVRFTKDPLVALFVFIAFRFPFFNMSGIRQGLALAITTFSYRYYQNNRTILFVIFVIIAALFHRSAIVFLILLLLGKINLIERPWIVYVLSVVMLIVSYVLSRIGVFSSMADSELLYAGYLANDEGGGNYFSVVFILLIYSMINIFLKSNKEKNKDESKKTYNVVVVAVFMSLLGLYVNLIFRVSMYLGFIVPILYSNALMNISNVENRKQLHVAGSFVMVVVYICTGVVDAYIPYKFYWE